MKTRRLLARIAAFVTVAATIGTFLGPASAEASDHEPDGWTNRKPDIGSNDLGSAMTQGTGSLLEGWANRDLDIGALPSAMVEAMGSRSMNLSTWRAQGTRAGGEVIGSDF
jgi:hypothetical protein